MDLLTIQLTGPRILRLSVPGELIEDQDIEVGDAVEVDIASTVGSLKKVEP